MIKIIDQKIPGLAKVEIFSERLPYWDKAEHYRGAVVDEDGVVWAWTEEDYETSLCATVPSRHAESSKGESHILHWWSRSRYTMEHFRRFVAMGFPSQELTSISKSNWSPEDIDLAYEQMAA